jgi:hypothetical protein
VIDLARGAITSKTRILELDGLDEFARLLDEPPSERSRRQATRRKLRSLSKRVGALENAAEDIAWHDVAEMDGRIEGLEEMDLGTLGQRVDDLESKVAELGES